MPLGSASHPSILHEQFANLNQGFRQLQNQYSNGIDNSQKQAMVAQLQQQIQSTQDFIQNLSQVEQLRQQNIEKHWNVQ